MVKKNIFLSTPSLFVLFAAGLSLSSCKDMSSSKLASDKKQSETPGYVSNPSSGSDSAHGSSEKVAGSTTAGESHQSLPPAEASDDSSQSPTPSPTAGTTASGLVEAGVSTPSALPSASQLAQIGKDRQIPKQTLGKQCTIVYSRHGEKDGDKLTPDGHKQVQQLSWAMQKFEHEHQKSFDYIFHSDYKRSIASAKPFLDFKNKSASKPYSSPNKMQQLLKEVDATKSSGKAEGKAKAPKLLAELKKYCKTKPGATIFVSGHGNMGVYLFQAMGLSGFAHEEAGPYVLTSDNGDDFKVTHRP